MAVILHPVGFRMRMVQLAMAEVGVVETGNNRGARVSEYQAATSLGVGPHAWCAAFCCWCYRETCKDLGCLGLLPTRPDSARAYDMEQWGDAHGRTFRQLPLHLIPGDFVIYDWSHIGIVAADSHPLNGRVFDVEGNTDDDRPGSPPGPDGVFCKWRSAGLRSIVRLYESTTPQT